MQFFQQKAHFFHEKKFETFAVTVFRGFGRERIFHFKLKKKWYVFYTALQRILHTARCMFFGIKVENCLHFTSNRNRFQRRVVVVSSPASL